MLQYGVAYGAGDSYTFLNSFYLDRGIWMLFLLSEGFSLTEVGLLESLYHIAAFLFEVPTGYVADRFGKKVSLVCGQALKITGAIMLVFGGGGMMLYAGFIMGAVAGTFLSGATGALVYETMKQTGRESGFKRLNSRLFAVMLISMGFASPAGGALAQIHWDALYLCAALLAGLSMVIVLLLKEPGREEGSAQENPAGHEAPTGFRQQLQMSAAVLRAHKGLLSLIVYGAPLFAVTTSAGFYVQVLLESNGMAKSLIGTFNGMETWLGAAAGAAA
jgi:MFS family permease